MAAAESPTGRLQSRDYAFAVISLVISVFMVGVSRVIASQMWKDGSHWNPDKVMPLDNINLSDMVWLNCFGIVFETGKGFSNILLREAPGLALIAALTLGPILVALTVLRPLYLKMGVFWTLLCVAVFEFLMWVPLRLWLQSAAKLKYVVYIPEYLFYI
jgi:hypothetical protein